MNLQAELDAILRGALLRPLPELTTIAVRGADRQSWLAGLVTCDVMGLRPGRGAYGLIVDKTGRVQAEVWIAVGEQQILVGVRAELAEAIRRHLEGYLVMEDAELYDDASRSWWLAHGPAAARVAERARALGGAAAMARLGAIETAMLVIPKGASSNAAEELTAGSGALIATPEGWERIRVERMLPRFGVDFEAGCYPQEASLQGLAVSFDKGCYVGQEAVFMLEKRGHAHKRLVLLAIDGAAPVASGAQVVSADGARVGAVTSAVVVDQGVLALATVRYRHSGEGTTLAVGDRRATVCAQDRR